MSIKIKNRHRLKKRDIRDIQKQIEDEFYIKIDFGNSVETGLIDDKNVILIDNTPCFTINDKKIFLRRNKDHNRIETPQQSLKT